MDTRIRDLVEKITALEDELRTALHERESRVQFTIRGKRIEFAQDIRATHQRLKRGFFRWLVTDRGQNLVTGPIIYGMALPMVLFDLCVTFYQLTCFPIYGVARVRRADYMVFDRHQLGYLNFIERFHCEYCAYGNGLMAYATEILARTELYFCPIKHARKIAGTHGRYAEFLSFGDAPDYHVRLEAIRVAMGSEKAGAPPPTDAH
ncbi:MAG: hypothetical protein WA174_14870 [Rhodoferax sp.]